MSKIAPKQNLLTFISNFLNRIEEFILVFSIFAMAILSVAGVFFRKMGMSLSFIDELHQAFIIAITFFGLSYAARKSRHIRMTALYEWLPTQIKKIVMIFTALITAITLGYLSYASLVYVQSVQQSQVVTPGLRIPTYLFYIPVCVGLILATIEYTLSFLINLIHKPIHTSSLMKEQNQQEPNIEEVAL